MHTDTPTATDNVHVAVYDAETAPTLEAAREAAPKREHSTHNTTRSAYHEAIIDALGGTTPELTADVLALGDSDAETSLLDAAAPLGNETFRTSITDSVVDGQAFTATIFIDSTEANGQSYAEAALVAETASGDLPINRFLISDPLLDPKQQGETVTVTIEITQQDA